MRYRTTKIYSRSRVFTVHWGTGVESSSSKTVTKRKRKGEEEKDNYPDSRPEDGSNSSNNDGKLLGRREENVAASLTHFMNEQKRAPGLVPVTSVCIHPPRREAAFRPDILINSPYFLYRFVRDES